MEKNSENEGKMLLHACCGPCSLEPVRLLTEAGVRPVIFYSNSNIYPPEEYRRRLETISEWASGMGLSLVEGKYDPKDWEQSAGRAGDAAKDCFGVVVHEAQPALPLDPSEPGNTPDAKSVPSAAVGGTEGEACLPSAPQEDSPAERARMARCRACYRQRFEEAAAYAAENGFPELSTTLSVSPYQYTSIIREELERAAERHGVRAVFADYRPYYDAATQRSREAGMYRQNYCGCRFSMEEAQLEREQRKQLRAQARRARQEATAAGRAKEEEQRQKNRQEKQAYQLKQQRKRAILKSLREARQE